MNFEVRMIRIKNHEVSEKYAKYCAPSWEGFNLKFYDAVTPDTLKNQRGMTFKNTANKTITDTEKACFYSQYNLWKQCARENQPYLILEHDALLIKPEAIHFNPNLFVQYFGQHAMEAVMFHPSFCRRLVIHLQKNVVTGGPMSLVDTMLGYGSTYQSDKGIPHSRFQGRYAPVKSVLDPKIGNTIDHPNKNIKDRISDPIQAELFEMISLS